MKLLHLNSQYLKIVQAILARNIPNYTVLAFGSRVTEDYKLHSDLDLCIKGDKILTFSQLAQLREDFSDSDLPIRVDIIEWENITPDFRKIVQKNNIQIQP